MKSLVFLGIIVLFSLPVFAKQDVAKVIFIKGTATELKPGQSKATPIIKNQTLQEDSSVLTQEKSVLKIHFFDGSQTTLGPNSKFIIKKSDPSKGSILGLLKGTIRTQLNKSDNKKLFIQTRTAALGVRGTDFQAIYNPEIHITSLVTYSGRVAMAKVTPTKFNLAAKLPSLTPDDENTHFDWVRNVTAKSKIADDFAEFDNLLDSQEAVEINPGRFSTTATNVSKPSVPVRISPAQFKVMKENTTLQEGNQKKIENLERETQIAQKSENIKIEKYDPPAEGYTNIAKNEFAPKAGGFIDVNSGIYIPPESDAKFDAQSKLFIPSQDIGGIAKDTGEYVAPKGLKLDAKKGFVEVAKIDEQTAKTKDELNKNIDQSNQKPVEEEKEDTTVSFWLNGPLNPDNKYKVGHHHIQFGIVPGNTAYRYANPYMKKSETYYTKPKGDFRLEYTWRFIQSMAAGISINEGDRKFKLAKQMCTGPDCKDDNSKYTWARRFLFASIFLNPKTYIKLGFGETETPYATGNSYGPYYNFTNISNPTLSSTLNYVFFAREKFKIMNEINLAYLLEQSEHSHTAKGFEVGYLVEALYEFNTWFGVYSTLDYTYRNLKVTNDYTSFDGFYVDHSQHKFHIHNYGVGLGVLFSI